MQKADCRRRNEHTTADRRPAAVPSSFHPIHPAEGSAAAVPRPAATTSLATLFTSHLLQDGEIVLLILKPSIWYMVVSGLRFHAMCGILICAGILLAEKLPGTHLMINFVVFMMALRLMWAILVWMGQVYVLSDRRIISISGVFNIEVFDCPLRRVARTRIIYSTRERILRLGTIQIIPSDDEMPDGAWQMIARPLEVHEVVVATISKIKQGGLGSA